MAQTTTKPCTVKSIMSTKAFRIGYEDAKSGFGFNELYDKFSVKEQWDYERGRQFAIATGGEIAPYVSGQGRGRPAVSPNAASWYQYHCNHENIT